jgi:hypothetical protein
MSYGNELFNLVLGLCAFGYSFVPADRVRSYRKGIALAMRGFGLLLILLSLVSLILKVNR